MVTDHFFYKNKQNGVALVLKEIIFGKSFQCPVCDFKSSDLGDLTLKIELLTADTPIIIIKRKEDLVLKFKDNETSYGKDPQSQSMNIVQYTKQYAEGKNFMKKSKYPSINIQNISKIIAVFFIIGGMDLRYLKQLSHNEQMVKHQKEKSSNEFLKESP